MKLKGNIDLLVNPDHTTITIRDDLSGELIAEVELTPEQFCEALSRRVYLHCEVKTGHLERIGKKMLMDKLTFEITQDQFYKKDREVLSEIAGKACPDGWIPDNYYGSKDSTLNQDGKYYARTTIRRWE